MTPEQKALVRASYAAVMADPDAFASTFYSRLFALDPSLRAFFPAEMKAQGRKFTDMLTAILECIDRMDQVIPVVWQSGRRHGGYGVEHQHYQTTGEALIWALDRQTPGGLSPETQAAWELLYSLLAAAMEQAAAEAPIPRSAERDNAI